MNRRWHSPNSQKVQIPILPTRSSWVSSFSCWGSVIVRDRASPEGGEELVWPCAGRHVLGHSRGLCQMPVVSVFFRGLACVPLPRTWSLIPELLPKPRRGKNSILFSVWPVSLINKHPFLFLYSEKGRGKQGLRRAAGATPSEALSRVRKSSCKLSQSCVFSCEMIHMPRKISCNVQTLLCLSWASEWGGDFCFCFSHFACLSLETQLQCFPFWVEAYPTSFKCPQVKGLYQRNSGHFKCYSLSFLVFFTQVR